MFSLLDSALNLQNSVHCSLTLKVRWTIVQRTLSVRLHYHVKLLFLK